MPINIPIILTWLRIAMIPLVVGLFYLPESWVSVPVRDAWAAYAFIIAALTDWFDGWLARRWNQTSAFGAFLDPVADKLMVCAALIVLLNLGRIDAFITLIIIGREITISALREWMAEIGQRRKVAVSQLGKYKTILQIIGLSMMLFRWDLLGLPIFSIGFLFTVVAAAFTLLSMFSYLRAAWPELKRH